jgi:hypothetical protein
VVRIRTPDNNNHLYGRRLSRITDAIMTKIIGRFTLLMLVVLLLASCATPPSTFLREYTGADAGYIIASVANRQKSSYSNSELGIRSLPDLLHSGMGYIESNFLTSAEDRQEDFNEKCEKGAVGVMRVKPGRYELYIVSTRNGRMSIFSGRAFSIVFEVKPNEAVYLGAFTAILDFNFGITPKVDEFYFNVTDRQERDLPIAIKKEPAIQAANVRAHILRPNDSTGTILRFDSHPECL